MASSRRFNRPRLCLGGESVSATAAIAAEQTARIVAVEAAIQDHSTRIRTIEDAIITMSAHTEMVAKAAKFIVGIVGLGLGLNVGELAGVIN